MEWIIWFKLEFRIRPWWVGSRFIWNIDDHLSLDKMQHLEVGTVNINHCENFIWHTPIVHLHGKKCNCRFSLTERWKSVPSDETAGFFFPWHKLYLNDKSMYSTRHKNLSYHIINVLFVICHENMTFYKIKDTVTWKLEDLAFFQKNVSQTGFRESVPGVLWNMKTWAISLFL